MLFGSLNDVAVKIVDPVFRPLLNLHPLLVMAILGLVVSFIIVLTTKYTTNQEEVKKLREDIKQQQKKMREVRDNPEEVMALNKKALQTQKKLFKESFSLKLMLYTFIPIMLILPWIMAYYAYNPIRPAEQFQITLTFIKGAYGNVSTVPPKGIAVVGDSVQEIVDGKAAFTFTGKEGNYIEGNAIRFDYKGGPAFMEVIITNGEEYAKQRKTLTDNNLKLIEIDYEQKRILTFFGSPINFLWFRGGWLGTYIIFSIIFSMIIRKVLKVY